MDEDDGVARHLGGNTEVESVSRRWSLVHGGVPEVAPLRQT